MDTPILVSDLSRRDFVKVSAATGLAALVLPHLPSSSALASPPDKPATNIAEALAIPRTAESLPGKYPGRVVEVFSESCLREDRPDREACLRMLDEGMTQLTGIQDPVKAWTTFVSPNDVVGLKVNPIGGSLLSTSIELVHAVIDRLVEAGIPKSQLVIWDRREFELHEAGFTAKEFPGIEIVGTEKKDEKGSFRDAEGALYSETMIDRKWYYWADCEEAYDEETLPYMVNTGKHSYFSTIVTQKLTKIINMPVLKNAGPTVTLCLKNLAYGAISNTGRLHKQLWGETCAQVPCFPPLRDKTVLNIVDGIRGCYQGGPAADPKYITDYKVLLFGTDPVAVDRIGYDIVLKKRLEMDVQKQESPRGTAFLKLAEEYKLGIAEPASIIHTRRVLS